MAMAVHAVEGVLGRGDRVVFRNVMVMLRRLVRGVPCVVHSMRDRYCGRGAASQYGKSGDQESETQRIAHAGILPRTAHSGKPRRGTIYVPLCGWLCPTGRAGTARVNPCMS